MLQDKRQKSQDKSENKEKGLIKIKDNPPSLPPSLAFRQSKKAMVYEESHKTKVEKHSGARRSQIPPGS